MKIVLASHNKHKTAELQRLLSVWIPDVEVISLAEAGIDGEIVEDGTTFEENALIKARFAARSGMIGVGDDSGLCVAALDDAPGIFSARYAGENATDGENNKKLLEALKNEPYREAKFVCCIAAVLPDGRETVARGEAEGEILVAPRGESGFGYDPLFWMDSEGKSFAEMGPDEKNAVSHRGNAIKSFAAKFAELLGEAEAQKPEPEKKDDGEASDERNEKNDIKTTRISAKTCRKYRHNNAGGKRRHHR